MLSRIWGRTHMRSTARDISNLHYSPLGEIHSIVPIPDPHHRVWYLDSTHPGDLDILLGYAVLNNLNVRVHTPSDALPSLVQTNATDLALKKTDVRKERPLRTNQLIKSLRQWDASMVHWQSALQTLQEIPFGSMNSLEVLQIILQALPKANLQFFRRIDISTFEWSEPEFRMLERTLMAYPDHDVSDPLAWPFAQMHINTQVFQDTDPTTCSMHIDQMIHDLLEIMDAIHQLGRMLTHEYRRKEDGPDWSTIQLTIGRSTLLTLPQQDAIQTQRAHLQTLVHAFSASLKNFNWFGDWSGFQFISFEEMDVEILLMHRRLRRLKEHLTEIIQASRRRQITQQYPSQIQAVLHVLPEHQKKAFIASFPCWYLSRWIEFRTPDQAWNILTDSTALHLQYQELQQAGWDLLDLNLYALSWQERIQLADHTRASASLEEDPSDEIDLYWQVPPPADLEHLHLKHQPAVPTGPELPRLIYLMKQLPPDMLMDLPAPLHLSGLFWEPTAEASDHVRFHLTSSRMEFAH
ncbi:MAG: hypothetical protein K9I85_00250 [Saprospiraceae bacterium]|nr:hypothetical protein [Saprospiraceae bacterium]